MSRLFLLLQVLSNSLTFEVMHTAIGHRGAITISIIAIIIPLLLWGASKSVHTLFSGTYNSLTTIAQVAGLLGICLFSVNIILSGRYQFIDRYFFGLDRAYKIHRRTGITAFTLMLAHVGAVSMRGLGSSELGLLWLDFSNKALTFGRVSFLGFLFIILLTLFAKIPYELLKKNHQTLGFFLFLGGVHAYLIPSDIAINQPLRWYVLGLVAIGVSSYVARTLLKPWIVPRHIFTITAVRKLGKDITEVVMRPTSGTSYTFTPGQFNFYKFIQPGFPAEDHPFSITAGSSEAYLRISAKALGDFTIRLPELKTGAKALVQGPYGGFTYQRGSKKQIWIAGGIGITPFMSMIRTLHNRNETGYVIDLFHSVKSSDEAVFANELQAAATELPNFAFHLWITSQDGLITAEHISQITSLEDKDIYICGPPAMIESLTKQLKYSKIPGRRIFSEKFKLL